MFGDSIEYYEISIVLLHSYINNLKCSSRQKMTVNKTTVGQMLIKKITGKVFILNMSQNMDLIFVYTNPNFLRIQETKKSYKKHRCLRFCKRLRGGCAYVSAPPPLLHTLKQHGCGQVYVHMYNLWKNTKGKIKSICTQL